VLGAESDRWQIVLVVVEQDGSLVLVAEPTPGLFDSVPGLC